jgi:tetratricopeptide (TPR) repeat protein
MDIEKLKKIVEKEDIKQFCDFFLELERGEILKLSGEEYDEVMELCSKLKGNEQLAQVVEFSSFILNEGYEALKGATKGRNISENALISKFYFDFFFSLSIKRDWDYASALTNKGINLGVLAEQGIEAESNLKESVKCFDEAVPIFKNEQSDWDYASALMNKGNSLMVLANLRIEAESNLKESVKCFDEATLIFKRDKSALDYARTLMNKGNSLMVLANLGIETENNLRKSIECIDEAAPIFKRESAALDYAKTLGNKGISLRILANLGIETENNLRKSIECIDEAAPIFEKARSDIGYAKTLVNKGISLIGLVERGIETENNFESAISSYVEAEDIFYEKTSFLMFVVTSFNHCTALWWKYTETKEDNYLENAIEIAKKAREESAHIVHPIKERLVDHLIQIYEIFKDKGRAAEKALYEEMRKKREEALPYLQYLPYLSMLPEMREDIIEIKVKTTTILEHVRGIETSCNRIIHDLEKSGVKLREKDKEELKTLAGDLKKANKEQLTNFTNELIKLLKDPKLKKEIEKKAPKERKSVVKKTFSKITGILNELGIALGAAVTAEALLPHIEAIMDQITILSEISPTLASTLILIPLIALKVKTVK